MWQEFKDAELAREYSPSSVVPNYRAVVAAYTSESRTVSTSLENHRLAYGPSSDEYSIVFAGRGAPDRVVVFIHGGYWQELSADDCCFPAREFVDRGISYASVNYALAPSVSIEAMVQQCAAAIQAIASAYPDASLVIAGSSAGAHLAAMMNTLDWAPGLTTRVKGYVLASGVYDLRPIARTYINAPLKLDSETAVAVSPMFMNPRYLVPTLVCWGEHETAEFKRQSFEFGQRLSSSDVPVQLLEVTGRNHFDILFDLAAPSSELGAAVDHLIGAS